MEEQATAKTKYRDLSTAAALPPLVEMTFVVGVDKKKQSIPRDDKQEKQWLGKVYIPLIAMNGAPDLLWLVEEDNGKATAKAKYRDLRCGGFAAFSRDDVCGLGGIRRKIPFGMENKRDKGKSKGGTMAGKSFTFPLIAMRPR